MYGYVFRFPLGRLNEMYGTEIRFILSISIVTSLALYSHSRTW